MASHDYDHRIKVSRAKTAELSLPLASEYLLEAEVGRATADPLQENQSSLSPATQAQRDLNSAIKIIRAIDDELSGLLNKPNEVTVQATGSSKTGLTDLHRLADDRGNSYLKVWIKVNPTDVTSLAEALVIAWRELYIAQELGELLKKPNTSVRQIGRAQKQTAIEQAHSLASSQANNSYEAIKAVAASVDAVVPKNFQDALRDAVARHIPERPNKR